MASNDSPAAVRPTGIVTFLFTDIEGSTGRWEVQSPEMSEALARHDAVLRTAIEAHGGWLFKHTGDGILAAFASPNEAVLAAVDAQRALELPVRMGIATGEAELRGDDYFGATLNRAARTMAAGHGGQMLLAQSTASMLTGVDLLDLGERRLRDLSGAQRWCASRSSRSSACPDTPATGCWKRSASSPRTSWPLRGSSARSGIATPVVSRRRPWPTTRFRMVPATARRSIGWMPNWQTSAPGSVGPLTGVTS